jgi:hypothetical protein
MRIGISLTESTESFGMLRRVKLLRLVAGAAARSLVTGTSFGDNLIAALPSVIGSTIGGSIARLCRWEPEYETH